MSDCLFCAIVAGDEPAQLIHADDHVVAFLPTERSARVHVLIVPRRHIPSVDALESGDRDLWWHMLTVAQDLARSQGIDVEREGYHLITNAGRHELRQFAHLHLHLGSGAIE